MLCAVQSGVLMFGFYQLLSSAYHAKPVARLPFEPFSFFRVITQRGLPPDTDPHLVSVVRSAECPPLRQQHCMCSTLPHCM
jgi:hypothetical protein